MSFPSPDRGGTPAPRPGCSTPVQPDLGHFQRWGLLTTKTLQHVEYSSIRTIPIHRNSTYIGTIQYVEYKDYSPRDLAAAARHQLWENRACGTGHCIPWLSRAKPSRWPSPVPGSPRPPPPPPLQSWLSAIFSPPPCYFAFLAGVYNWPGQPHLLSAFSPFPSLPFSPFSPSSPLRSLPPGCPSPPCQLWPAVASCARTLLRWSPRHGAR